MLFKLFLFQLVNRLKAKSRDIATFTNKIISEQKWAMQNGELRGNKYRDLIFLYDMTHIGED